MLIYEYPCDSCSCRFENKQGLHDDPITVYQKCQEMARRVFHPAPIILKGSGFYVTDNRGNGDKGVDTKLEKTPGKPPDNVEPKE